MTKLLITLFTVTLFTACSFDSNSPSDTNNPDTGIVGPTIPNPPTEVAPADPGTSEDVCEIHTDCDDGFSCTLNRCMSGVCKTYDNPEMDCECVLASDCSDGLSCTDDYCTEDGVCENLSTCSGSDVCHVEFDTCAPADAECVLDSHCDDSDSETDDYCTDYVCEYLTVFTVCGNDDCEIGENSTSCPVDCSVVEVDLEIDCQVSGADMTITITGDVAKGIFLSAPTDNPTYLEYGSETDGWGPYTSGKPMATWDSNIQSYTLILSASVQNMNFFLYGTSSGDIVWFDLDQWNVTGDCYRDGGGIRH